MCVCVCVCVCVMEGDIFEIVGKDGRKFDVVLTVHRR